MIWTSSMCVFLAASLTSVSAGQAEQPVSGTHSAAKVTASQCRNQVLPLKNQPQSYFDALPERRLRSLDSLAGSCNTVPDLSVQEESDIAGVRALIANRRTNRVPESLPQESSSKSVEPPSECHDFIAHLTELSAAFMPAGLEGSPKVSEGQETAWMQQQMTRIQQLADWQEELGDCAVNKPEQLSIKDWQNALFTYSTLQEESGKISGEFAVINQRDASKALSDIYKDDDQQRLNEYNSLVRKYNDLVRDYNNQRDLLIRLSATPIQLPPSRTFIHCDTFATGSVGTIDCY